MGQLSIAMARPFIQAVEETFRTMAQVPAKHKAVLTVAESAEESDISITAGLAGQTKGWCVLRVEEAFADTIVRGLKLTDEEEVLETQTIWDGLCDVLGLVLDHAQRVHEGNNIQYDVALPLVVTGRKVQYGAPGKGDSGVLVFETDSGKALQLVLCIGATN